MDPTKSPHAIIGATHDLITPIHLFEQDKRFHRDNITIKKIHNAGHLPWIEDLKSVTDAFQIFQTQLITRR